MKIYVLVAASIVLVSLILILSLNTGTAPIAPTVLVAENSKVNPENQTFILSSNRPEDSPINLWWTMIYTEAFKRLNIPVEVKSFPLARASYMADHGLVDGEAIRVYSYSTAHPNLVRVEESTIPLRVVAFTGVSAISGLNGWEGLRNTEYIVEYVHGAPILENNLKKHLKPGQSTGIFDVRKALQKLALGRSDLYVDDENVVLPLLEYPEIKDKITVAGVMCETPLHMYLHKRHAALEPKLSKVIRDMKNEGLMEKFRISAYKNQD